MIEQCNARLKTSVVYDDETMQQILVRRWNGAIEILTQGISVNINDENIKDLAKELQRLVKTSYDDDTR